MSCKLVWLDSLSRRNAMRKDSIEDLPKIQEDYIHYLPFIYQEGDLTVGDEITFPWWNLVGCCSRNVKSCLKIVLEHMVGRQANPGQWMEWVKPGSTPSLTLFKGYGGDECISLENPAYLRPSEGKQLLFLISVPMAVVFEQILTRWSLVPWYSVLVMLSIVLHYSSFIFKHFSMCPRTIFSLTSSETEFMLTRSSLMPFLQVGVTHNLAVSGDLPRIPQPLVNCWEVSRYKVCSFLHHSEVNPIRHCGFRSSELIQLVPYNFSIQTFTFR